MPLSDQVPPVAEPPTLPPKAADVPVWQMAVMAGPASAVAVGFTVITTVLVMALQGPVDVRVSVTLPFVILGV